MRPVVDRFAVFAHAELVASFGADVEFGGEIAFLVFEVQHRRFDRVCFVIVSDQKEHRWRISRDAEARMQLRFVVFVEKAAAVDVDKDEEVRPAGSSRSGCCGYR